jgi:chaperonin GroEL
VTDAERGEAVLRDPLLLLVDGEVTAAGELLAIIDAVAATGRPLAVLAADVTGAALEDLAASRADGRGALAARVAGDPYTRELVLGDLAVVTGASIVGTSTISGNATPLARASLGALGGAAKVVASRDRVLVAGGAADAAAIADRIGQVRSQIEAAETPAERQELFTRLAKLAGGAATVRAGAATSTETARLVTQAERGLAIARLAMVNPVLPGGGAALADVQQALAKFPRSVPGGRSGDEAAGARIVLDSLTAPLGQIAQNAGVPAPVIDKALKSRKDGTGIDPATGKTIPMRPHAVDILPVLQAAVANATALTIRVLTS